MDGLSDVCPVAVRLHDLLDSPGGKRDTTLRLEQVAVFRVGLEVAAQYQAEALGEQDVAIFTPLTLVDEDLALLQISLVYVNTLMVQRLLSEPAWSGRLTTSDLRALTPLVYAHVNPYGIFRLDMNARLPIDPTDEPAT